MRISPDVQRRVRQQDHEFLAPPAAAQVRAAQAPADDLARVWLDGQHVVVDLQQQRADEVVITVLDGAGRVVAERRTRLSTTRERIPVDHVAEGVILVRLLTADQGRTYKLPLTR